jgi:parallel beta-helix repeat protein
MGFVGILVFDGILDQPSASAAATRYVGGTGLGNYSTIQDAINASNAGDTIRVYAGVYYENLIVNKTLSLIGNGSANTTINGGGTGDVVLITANWVNITGFNITNSGDQGTPPVSDAGIEVNGVNNVTICDNILYDNNYGIYFKLAEKNNISNNICGSNRLCGILLSWTQTTYIFNNICIFNRIIGIYLYFSQNNLVQNNTFNSNGCGNPSIESGIGIFDSNSNTILNNTCKFNADGIRLFRSNSNIIINNSCSNSTYSGIYLADDSNYNRIENNYCNNNGIEGLKVTNNSNYNIICYNTCWDNELHGIFIYISDSNILEDNYCYSNDKTTNITEKYWPTEIRLENTRFITLKNNRASERGIYIVGSSLVHFNSHSIDASNFVEGKPIYYWSNRTSGTVPAGAAQVFLVNCSNVRVEDQLIRDRSFGLSVVYSNNINIETMRF